MCRRIACEVCGKPSFAGCGMHVEQVLADVPKAERCRCAEERASDKQSASGAPKRESWLRNLFR
jgi:hypothetical protein